MIEIIGTSPDGIDAAIRNGLARAAETTCGLDWFEVQTRRQNPNVKVFHPSLWVTARKPAVSRYQRRIVAVHSYLAYAAKRGSRPRNGVGV